MKNIFKKFKTNESVIDVINAHRHPICRSINHLDLNISTGQYYLNPDNQTSFNFGSFAESDFNDWLNGTGKIIKGKTSEEKKKFWEYAKFLQLPHTYSILHEYDMFNLIIDDHSDMFNHHLKSSHNLKVTPKNHSEIIGKYAGYVCDYLADDLEYSYQSILDKSTYLSSKEFHMPQGILRRTPEEFREIDERISEHIKHAQGIFYGGARVFFAMGIGYFDACNTPRDIYNLNWMSELLVSKAIYKTMKKLNFDLPDFEFILNYRK